MKVLTIVRVTHPIRWEYLTNVANTDLMLVLNTECTISIPHPREIFTGQIIIVNDLFRKKYLPYYAYSIERNKFNIDGLNFGLYYAWKEDYDYAIILDEDCDTRITPDFIQRIPIGKIVKANKVKLHNRWYNPLWQIYEPNAHLYARGFPFNLRDLSYPAVVDTVAVVPKFNQGLWIGYPDINAIDSLDKTHNLVCLEDRPIPQSHEMASLTSYPVMLNRKQYLPASICNVQICRDLIPAYYQAPDYVVYDTNISRHSDIWSVYILKILMDLRSDKATVGEPFVYRNKPPASRREVQSENHANLIQPVFMNAVDHAYRYVPEDSYSEMIKAMAESLMYQGKHTIGTWGEVIFTYANHLNLWSKLFQY